MSAVVPDTLGLPYRRGVLGPLATLEIGPANSERLVVYLHGGGYTCNSVDTTAPNASLLASAIGCRVVALDYPLAPGSTCLETTRLIVESHQALLASGMPAAGIGYVGDSAGGGLVAGSVLRMRDEGVAMPGALGLLSPWTDLTNAGDTRSTLAPHDPVQWQELELSARVYAGELPLTHPYASPVYGDYQDNFPSTLLQAGTREILLSDAVRLYRAIADAGGRAILDVYDGMPHIWMFGEPGSSSSAAALAKVADFMLTELDGV